jgi:cytoskeletal protein RodZ
MSGVQVAMPLDTGAVTDEFGLAEDASHEDVVTGYAPSLETAPSLGDGLRTIREYHGLDLDRLARETRIRRHYLAAIEEMRLDLLPSRPFTIGYIRAYAAALDVDPEQAVARFKLDYPDEDEPLRAPVGVKREGDPRLALIVLGVVVVTSGVVIWNVAQRSLLADAPKAPSSELAPSSAKVASAAPAPITVAAPPDAGAAPLDPSAAPPSGVLPLGAPLPPPPEATTPKPYDTPGIHPNGAQASASPDSDPTADDGTGNTVAPVAFAAHGAVYGAPAKAGGVILQAKKAVGLVVHAADGSIYFARQLAAGEAYRAPALKGLTVDVTDPSAVDYFVGGMLKGSLPSSKLAVSSLAGG